MTELRRRIVEYLSQGLFPICLERWWDERYGGFHERLDERLEPVALGYKRLLVQCRQIYVHCHAALLTGDGSYRHRACQGFEYLCRTFRDRTHGGWYFKVRPDGIPLDRTKDAYAHAFVLFACAWYYRLTQDTDALVEANHGHEVLERRLAAPAGGYWESATGDWEIIPAVRRQNPHMHLLESYVALHEATEDPRHRDPIVALLDLFRARFLDAATGTVGEFFDDDWSPDPESGSVVEPGHHFEWAWLLHRCGALLGRPALGETAEKLHGWAMRFGWDGGDGGVVDRLDRSGKVIAATKRIWPLTECLQSCAAWIDLGEMKSPASEKPELEPLVEFLLGHYLRTDGSWFEHLDRELRPIERDLPGSTPYHIVQALTDALDIL